MLIGDLHNQVDMKTWGKGLGKGNSVIKIELIRKGTSYTGKYKVWYHSSTNQGVVDEECWGKCTMHTQVQCSLHRALPTCQFLIPDLLLDPIWTHPSRSALVWSFRGQRLRTNDLTSFLPSSLHWGPVSRGSVVGVCLTCDYCYGLILNVIQRTC